MATCKPFRTVFEKVDQNTFIFMFPKNFRVDTKLEYITAHGLNEPSFYVDNLNDRTYEIKFLQTTNSLFLSDSSEMDPEITALAECSHYVEITECAPNVKQTYNQIVRGEEVDILSSVGELADYISNYLLFDQKRLFTDVPMQREISIILARQYVNTDVEIAENGELRLSGHYFDSNMLVAKVRELNLGVSGDYIVYYYTTDAVGVKEYEYSNFLAFMIKSGLVAGLQVRQCEFYGLENSVYCAMVEKNRVNVSLDPIKLVSDILFFNISRQTETTVSRVIDELQDLELPTQFYVFLDEIIIERLNNAVEYFKEREFIVFENQCVTLQPQLVSVLCSAKIIGDKNMYRSMCMYTDFRKPLSGDTTMLYIDEHSISADARGALKLSELSGIYTSEQLQRLFGAGYLKYFKPEDEEVAHAESYIAERIKFYSYKRELAFMAQ